MVLFIIQKVYLSIFYYGMTRYLFTLCSTYAYAKYVENNIHILRSTPLTPFHCLHIVYFVKVTHRAFILLLIALYIDISACCVRFYMILCSDLFSIHMSILQSNTHRVGLWLVFPSSNTSILLLHPLPHHLYCRMMCHNILCISCVHFAFYVI